MWIDILQILLGFLGGVVVGFFVSKKLMTKYLQKNPPINEEMIKTLMSGMGRTPTQKQVNQMMKQMQKYM
ncbi:MAG: YneF family protein [Bacilli bacterium]|nr:YneF family protein [Bacilli bacterium]